MAKVEMAENIREWKEQVRMTEGRKSPNTYSPTWVTLSTSIITLTE